MIVQGIAADVRRVGVLFASVSRGRFPRVIPPREAVMLAHRETSCAASEPRRRLRRAGMRRRTTTCSWSATGSAQQPAAAQIAQQATLRLDLHAAVPKMHVLRRYITFF